MLREIHDIQSFHPLEKEINTDLCMGRRSVPSDSRWKPRLYHATQCIKKPMVGSDLCVTCLDRASKGTSTSRYGWEGRVDDVGLKSLPLDSRIAGSEWFFMMLKKGKLTLRDQVMSPHEPVRRPLYDKQGGVNSLLGPNKSEPLKTPV